MGDEVRLWRIDSGEYLTPVAQEPLDLESRLQEWLTRDISLLDPTLLVIGREVETDYGGFIDILCIDSEGDLVIVELKRDKTPREVTAQALDYASWVVSLSNERVTSIADAYLRDGLEAAFRAKYDGTDLPETLNGDHRILIVGSQIDANSERIIRYLSDTHGVNINAATFQHFRSDGSELVARVFLIKPTEVELRTRIVGGSKRRPNLSYEQLRALASKAGVQDLYEYAVVTFERRLKKHTTQSSIAFTGWFNGSRKTIVSLIPGRSNATDGLCYELYKNRFAELTEVEDVEVLMPAAHTEWSYGDPGSDLEGYEGFITTQAEIDRLTDALNAAVQTVEPPPRSAVPA